LRKRNSLTFPFQRVLIERGSSKRRRYSEKKTIQAGKGSDSWEEERSLKRAHQIRKKVTITHKEGKNHALITFRERGMHSSGHDVRQNQR